MIKKEWIYIMDLEKEKEYKEEIKRLESKIDDLNEIKETLSKELYKALKDIVKLEKMLDQT